MNQLKSKKNVTQEEIISTTAKYLKDDLSIQICEKLRQKDGVWSKKNTYLFPNEINSAFENSNNLTAFITNIKGIETKILSNKSYTKDVDKYNKTLMALAVARYSSFFWINNENGNPQGKIKWLDKIKDDLEGAGTGAGVGVLIGGAGGAVIGGIAGAIIGSCCIAFDIPIVIPNK